MAGIVNFGIDSSNHILLPEHALALQLHWDRVHEGNFTPLGNVITLRGLPILFKLKFKIGLRIPKAELGEHGVQLVTMHL